MQSIISQKYRGPILGPRVPPDKQGLPPDKQVLPLDKQVLRVIFHVLVSDAWQWDDKDSRAHIRFGHPELGDWQTNCGEVTWSGYVIYRSLIIGANIRYIAYSIQGPGHNIPHGAGHNLPI